MDLSTMGLNDKNLHATETRHLPYQPLQPLFLLLAKKKLTTSSPAHHMISIFLPFRSRPICTKNPRM